MQTAKHRTARPDMIAGAIISSGRRAADLRHHEPPTSVPGHAAEALEAGIGADLDAREMMHAGQDGGIHAEVA